MKPSRKDQNLYPYVNPFTDSSKNLKHKRTKSEHEL